MSDDLVFTQKTPVEEPTLYTIGDQLEVTEQPLLPAAPPPGPVVSEFEKQAPYVIGGMALYFILGILLKGKKS